MNKAELDDIFARVEDGVSDAELKRVADFISDTTDFALQRRGLHILGWAHAREYAPVIAGFLHRVDHITLPMMAIRALVLWFGDAEPYLATLKLFMRGIPQDEGRDLQLAALQVAGEAYQQTSDPEILGIIVDIAGDGDELFREAAQESLAAALTAGWLDMTPKQKYGLRRAALSVDYAGQARSRLAGLPAAASTEA